jgi:hypothetical protein
MAYIIGEKAWAYLIDARCKQPTNKYRRRRPI